MTFAAAYGSIGVMLWTFALALAFVSGYATSAAMERYRQRYLERERVVNALAGGAVPDWERVARGLEEAALKQAHQGLAGHSDSLLRQARDVRKEGLANQGRFL